MAAVHRAADRIAAAVLPLTVAAGAAALLVPSAAVAGRSDLLLAALVLATALGIEPHRLVALRRRPAAVLALALGPFVLLVPLAWGLGRLFEGPVRDGVVVLGLAPTEVAAVGLVAHDLTPAFCLGLRDFAVAAALAEQAFGPRAAVVAGVYGVMMLVAGAALAAAERRGLVRRRPGIASPAPDRVRP
jgi:predicted Na+-dependent transporter